MILSTFPSEFHDHLFEFGDRLLEGLNARVSFFHDLMETFDCRESNAAFVNGGDGFVINSQPKGCTEILRDGPEMFAGGIGLIIPDSDRQCSDFFENGLWIH